MITKTLMRIRKPKLQAKVRAWSNYRSRMLMVRVSAAIPCPLCTSGPGAEVEVYELREHPDWPCRICHDNLWVLREVV